MQGTHEISTQGRYSKKGCAHIGKRSSQRYELIDHMRKTTQYSTNEMCDGFDISRSSYRHFSSDKMTRSKAERIRLVAEMKSIHNDSKLKVYGSPRMMSELHDRGWTCSESTVATLMPQHGLVTKDNHGRQGCQIQPQSI